MQSLRTWAGKSSFEYSGSIKEGTHIFFGQGLSYNIHISAAKFSDLITHFKGKTVEIGTSFDAPPRRSLGEWLQSNVTKTATASYVGSILIYEKHAQRIGDTQIKIL